VNTDYIKTAKDYLAWDAGLGPYDSWPATIRDKYKALFKTLSPQERYLVQRDKIEDYFTEENRTSHPPHEELSPSGRYRLVVTSYGTKPGSWNGEVFRTSDGVKVADVKRNYSSFSNLFMEDHIDGHDYLICGEDYQGQTFCQLDTGEVKPLIPNDAFEGFGFCWASYELMADGKTLLVNGCYWACPYEFRLYDVSDPMNGWPLLEVEKEGEKDSRASFDDYKANHSASLAWGVEAGPLRLELWVRGKGNTKTEFSRTREGILNAWEAAQAHLAAEVRE
jgi:hypothetical protein